MFHFESVGPARQYYEGYPYEDEIYGLDYGYGGYGNDEGYYGFEEIYPYVRSAPSNFPTPGLSAGSFYLRKEPQEVSRPISLIQLEAPTGGRPEPVELKEDEEFPEGIRPSSVASGPKPERFIVYPSIYNNYYPNLIRPSPLISAYNYPGGSGVSIVPAYYG